MRLLLPRSRRVLLVEYDLQLQSVILNTILSAADYELTAVCSSSREALRILRHTPVDIALVNLRLANGSGLDVVQAVKQLQPQSEVLVMGTADDKEDIFSSLEAGASAYLLKEDFIRAARLRISSGACGIPVSQMFGSISDADSGLAGMVQGTDLSAVQKRILRCLADGLSNKEIARRLLLSSYNVDYHLKCLRKRFSVRNRVQLVSAAMPLFHNRCGTHLSHAISAVP